MIQRFCFALFLLTWLKLGAATDFRSKQIEERLRNLEDHVARMKAAKGRVVEAFDENGVVGQDIITITGCDNDATAFMKQFLLPLTQEFSKELTAITVSCGQCSSVTFEGNFRGLMKLCKTNTGAPCISQKVKATCDRPHKENDLKFPFRMPIDGTTIGEVDIIVTVDKPECFTLSNPPAYEAC